jgi:hypothetical protein
MKKRSLTPAIRRLLAHALGSSGTWLASEITPYRIALQAVEAADKRGLVAIERTRDGEISGARITARGREEMGADLVFQAVS